MSIGETLTDDDKRRLQLAAAAAALLLLTDEGKQDSPEVEVDPSNGGRRYRRKLTALQHKQPSEHLREDL